MSGGVSIRYARAIFEIGLEMGTFEKMRDELLKFVEVYEISEELRIVLHNPSIDLVERKGIVKAISTKLRISKPVMHFLFILLDKDRMSEVANIGRALRTLVDDRAGVVRAEITSASKLDPRQLSAMKSVLGKMTGKKVMVERKVDPAIIGGVITRIGGVVYDGSIRSQLDGLRQAAADQM